jgi:leader peptidase (prepilin peptidase)/N-methyltransferase
MTLLGLILFITGFIFIIGLCIGSFLNVVILRSLSGESIVLPRSKCPKCKSQLKWYHNIPVLSYIFLRGKCAFCGEKISIQYPIIELFTGFIFLLLFLKFGIGLNFISMAIFSSILIVLAVTDLKEKVVFDIHTYSLIILGLIYNFFSIGYFNTGVKMIHLSGHVLPLNNSIVYSLLGLIVGAVVMEAMARFGYLVAGARAFGEGDTLIAAGLGSIFGIKYFFTILLYSIIIQVIAALPVFFKKLYDQKDFRTITALVVFVLYLILFQFISGKSVQPSGIVYAIMLAILCIIGIYLCKRILGGVKHEENRTYLPFGPALVAAAFIVMFIV